MCSPPCGKDGDLGPISVFPFTELINDELGLLAALIGTLFIVWGRPLADPIAALILAFTIRTPGDLRRLAPELVAMTALFSATSMEAIVITFERRTGALEWLLLAPLTLPAMLAGKVPGGMLFGLERNHPFRLGATTQPSVAASTPEGYNAFKMVTLDKVVSLLSVAES